jgi:hypothetical protein
MPTPAGLPLARPSTPGAGGGRSRYGYQVLILTIRTRGSIMYVLNYWHTIGDYAEWKKLFDSDPLGRESSGVRRYSIERPLDDEHTVIGELDFDTRGEAETFAGRLQGLWGGPASQTVSNAGYRITEVMEQQHFGDVSGRRAA